MSKREWSHLYCEPKISAFNKTSGELEFKISLKHFSVDFIEQAFGEPIEELVAGLTPISEGMAPKLGKTLNMKFDLEKYDYCFGIVAVDT